MIEINPVGNNRKGWITPLFRNETGLLPYNKQAPFFYKPLLISQIQSFNTSPPVGSVLLHDTIMPAAVMITAVITPLMSFCILYTYHRQSLLLFLRFFFSRFVRHFFRFDPNRIFRLVNLYVVLAQDRDYGFFQVFIRYLLFRRVDFCPVAEGFLNIHILVRLNKERENLMQDTQTPLLLVFL